MIQNSTQSSKIGSLPTQSQQKAFYQSSLQAQQVFEAKLHIRNINFSAQSSSLLQMLEEIIQNLIKKNDHLIFQRQTLLSEIFMMKNFLCKHCSSKLISHQQQQRNYSTSMYQGLSKLDYITLQNIQLYPSKQKQLSQCNQSQQKLCDQSKNQQEHSQKKAKNNQMISQMSQTSQYEISVDDFTQRELSQDFSRSSLTKSIDAHQINDNTDWSPRKKCFRQLFDNVQSVERQNKYYNQYEKLQSINKRIILQQKGSLQSTDNNLISDIDLPFTDNKQAIQ